MDRTAVLTLISETMTQDDYGIWRSVQSQRDVYCQVNSVSRAEFYEAGRNGLNPEYELTMFAGDYQGEKLCKLDGQSYTIYRTYLTKNDTLELYVIRRGGSNGEPENIAG